MKTYEDILHAIGRTPLVKLNKVAPEGGAKIYAKCEYMNPSGSIKDRMAPYIIERAEQEGLLKPGGVIVENTSGNTGQSLAMAAAVKGYRCVFTMPDKMSREKINSMKAYGAEVIITPTDVPDCARFSFRRDSDRKFHQAAAKLLLRERGRSRRTPLYLTIPGLAARQPAS